jgi:hypothetical protein
MGKYNDCRTEPREPSGRRSTSSPTWPCRSSASPPRNIPRSFPHNAISIEPINTREELDVPFANGERGESESDSKDDALIPSRSGVPVAVSEDGESSHDREVDCRRERGSVI